VARSTNPTDERQEFRMRESTEFTIGSQVTCSDGVCGELKRVVVEPLAHVLTHLVVEPRLRPGAGRLVPVDLVGSAAKEIRLRCTKAEFDALEEAKETHFLPGASGDWGYAQEQLLAQPYYRLAAGALSPDAEPQEIRFDRVPPGEVEVRRGDQVHAADGDIGRIRGLVVDSSGDHVTHVLLDEGHPWGQKRVAIPIAAVKRVKDGVQLELTRNEVRDLPPVELELPE
jgi:hypothetical protein